MIFGHAEIIEGAEDFAQTYDSADAVAEALALIDPIAIHALDPQTARALGRPLQERIRRLVHWVRARAESSFRVTVIGEFKRGKSTLVNALLGQSVAASSVLPETLLVSRYRWGENMLAQLRFADGARRTLESAELNRARLEEILAISASPVDCVEVSLPSALVRDSVLVDTPGLGDVDAAGRRRIFEEVANSDLVIVVARAGLQISTSERTLLEALVKPHEFARILFVVNAIDAIEDNDDLDRLRDAMARQAGALFPGAHVHMVSAKDELALCLADPRPDPSRALAYADLFEGFRADLRDLIAVQKTMIRTDRLLASAQTALGEIAGRIQMVRHQLAHQLDGVDERAAAADQEKAQTIANFAMRSDLLAGEIAALGEEAAEWMRDFGLRLGSTLSTQLKEVDTKEAERALQFFLCDAAQSAMATCMEAHREALEALTFDMGVSRPDPALSLTDRARGVARSAYSGPQQARLGMVRQLVDQMTGAGVVFDLGLALAERVGFGRDASVADFDSRLNGRALGASLTALTKEAYAELADRLGERLKVLSTAAEEAAEETAQQVRLLANDQSGSIQQAVQALERFTDGIDDARARVRTLRQRTA